MGVLRRLLRLAGWLLAGILGGAFVYSFWIANWGLAAREWAAENFRYRQAKHLYQQGRASYLEFSAGGLSDAENYLRAALDLRPRYAKAHAGLGELYAAWASMARYRGENSRRLSEKALRESLSAIALEPRLFESHRSLGAAFTQTGEFKLAVEEENRALALRPKDQEAQFWKWVAEGGKSDPAYFRTVEDDASYDFLVGLVSIGFRLAGQDKSEQARQFFTRAESLTKKKGTDIPLIHLGLAYTYMHEAGSLDNPRHVELIEKALSELTRATELDDKLIVAHENMGQVYLALGRWPDALLHFERALQINREYSVAAYDKAVALYELGQIRPAIDAWKSSDELSNVAAPPETVALGKLSEALWSYLEGRAAQAADAYRDAVEAGNRNQPRMHLDSPEWCLKNQVLGPRGIVALRALIKLHPEPAQQTLKPQSRSRRRPTRKR